MKGTKRWPFWNRVMGGNGVHPLPVFMDGKQCVSVWRPSLRERLSMLFLGRVWLWVAAPKMPVVGLAGKFSGMKVSGKHHPSWGVLHKDASGRRLTCTTTTGGAVVLSGTVIDKKRLQIGSKAMIPGQCLEGPLEVGTCIMGNDGNIYQLRNKGRPIKAKKGKR